MSRSKYIYFMLVILFLFYSDAYSFQGKVVKNEASLSTGYSWYAYTPRSLDHGDKTHIVVSAVQYDCSKTNNDKEANRYINGLIAESEIYKFVLLVPSFSKNCNSIFNEWTLHFPEYVFSGSYDDQFYRPDLKLNNMVDELKLYLHQNGLYINDRIFIYGYSISGHFANRYSLLHPDRIQAVAAGGLSGLISLPFSSYAERRMDWFLGVNNFESITGLSFDYSAYENIPQYYFWGENDLFPYHLDESFPEWVKVWGSNNVEALTNQCTFLSSQIPNATCREYAGIGHQETEQTIVDVFNFFAQSVFTLAVSSTGTTNVLISATPNSYGGMANYTKSNIPNGAQITLTAPASNENAIFSSWSGCDSTNQLDRTCALSMDGNRTVTANYIETHLTNREKANKLFDWLESEFPQILFPTPQQTLHADNIYARFYSGLDVAIGTIGTNLYFLDQTGVLHNLGAVDVWLPYAL